MRPRTTSTTRKLVLLVALFAVITAGFALYAPRFAQPMVVTSILQFSTLLALVSLGQGLVVLSGGAGIDLSVGGTVSLSAVLSMMAVRAGAPAELLPLLAIGCGLL